MGPEASASVKCRGVFFRNDNTPECHRQSRSAPNQFAFPPHLTQHRQSHFDHGWPLQRPLSCRPASFQATRPTVELVPTHIEAQDLTALHFRRPAKRSCDIFGNVYRKALIAKTLLVKLLSRVLGLQFGPARGDSGPDAGRHPWHHYPCKLPACRRSFDPVRSSPIFCWSTRSTACRRARNLRCWSACPGAVGAA
jgi:hypothetical protein